MCELHAYQTKPVGISGYCNIPKMVSLNLANAKESTLNHIPSRGFKNSPFRNTYTAVFTIGVHFYCFTRIPFLAVNSKQQPQKLYTAAVLWFLFNGKRYWPLHLDCFNMFLPSVGVDTLQCPGSLFENSGARSHSHPFNMAVSKMTRETSSLCFFTIQFSGPVVSLAAWMAHSVI